MILPLFKSVMLLVAIWVVLPGCSVFMSPPLEVVERSKDEVPQWTQQAAISNIEDQRLVFVYSQSQLYDLPLGAKETQLAAFTHSEQNLQDLLLSTLIKLATEANASGIDDQELRAVLTPKVKSYHGKYAQVSDVYYEKLRDRTLDDTVEYYRVYVRIDFPVDKSHKLLMEIAQLFKSKSQQEYRRLGSYILEANQNIVFGH